MAFQDLENRFNENVNKLYANATSKFEGGIPSKGKNDAPLIVRKPGAGYWGKMESRMLPVKSTVQDVKRLTLFQLSKDGLLFLAKQQLLQLGNTFEFTRAINPAFAVANAVPFLHIKRNLRPVAELIAKSDRSDANIRTLGQLQFGTYNALKSKDIRPVLVGVASGPDKKSRFGTALKSALLGPLKSLKDTATGALSAFNPLQKRNVGEIKDKWGKESWALSRPELVTYIPSVRKKLFEYPERYAEKQKETSVPKTPSKPSSLLKP
jgi:hypothetical protein